MGWCVCVWGGGEGITIVSGPGVVVRSNPPNPPPPLATGLGGECHVLSLGILR